MFDPTALKFLWKGVQKKVMVQDKTKLEEVYYKNILKLCLEQRQQKLALGDLRSCSCNLAYNLFEHASMVAWFGLVWLDKICDLIC